MKKQAQKKLKEKKIYQALQVHKNPQVQAQAQVHPAHQVLAQKFQALAQKVQVDHQVAHQKKDHQVDHQKAHQVNHHVIQTLIITHIIIMHTKNPNLIALPKKVVKNISGNNSLFHHALVAVQAKNFY